MPTWTVARLRRWWEVGFLAVLAGFMLWVRLRPYKAFLGGPTPLLNGPDAYYHYRAVLGAVQSFPALPRWDPWTAYPHGAWMGQFSTAFDWLAALLVILVHGRDATDAQVAQVLAVYPALMGALLVVPLYYLARRLAGRPGALVAALAFALLPGELLRRSLAGYADHHVAEVLGLLLSALALLVAMERAHEARAEPRAARAALAWGALAGAALAFHVLLWPPALLFLAPLALWALGVVLLASLRGEDAGPMARAAGAAFLAGALLLLPFVETWRLLSWFSLAGGATWDGVHVLSLLAAGLAVLGVQAGAAFALRRGLAPGMVASLFGLLALAGVLLLFALDALLGGPLSGGIAGVTGLRADDSPVTAAATIAEGRAPGLLCWGADAGGYCLPAHMGLGVLAGVPILLGLAAWTLRTRRRGDLLLLVLALWAYGLGLAQVRFAFYLAPAVALLAGWAAARLVDWPTLRARLAPPRHVLAAGAVVLLVVPGALFPLGGAEPGWVRAGQERPADMQRATAEALAWMRDATPDAGVDLGLVLDAPPEGGYRYPPEAYGVLAWWGEGHAIQALAHRPPVANPFQQGAALAALYFTDRDPEAADRFLDAATGEAGPVRYVLVTATEALLGVRSLYPWAQEANASRAGPTDAHSRFTAPAPYRLQTGETVALPTAGPAYRETMLSRLYHDDGAGLAHYRLVWEHPTRLAVGSVATVGGPVCVLTLLAERCRINLPSEEVRAYRPGGTLAVGENVLAYDLKERPVVLVYERVPGARLVGNATPGSLVRASVDVVVDRPDAPPRAFQVARETIAGPDGRFELTFPYATADLLGPAEGGTETPVRAQGPVRVAMEHATRLVHVRDEAVLRGLAVEVPG